MNAPAPTSAKSSSATVVLGSFRQSTIDRLLPPLPDSIDIHERAELLRKGRLLVASSLLLLFAAVFFLILSLTADNNWGTTATLLFVAVLFAIAIPIGFRFALSLETSTWMLLIATIVLMTTICLDELGLQNSALWWLLVVPPLAVVLLGRQAAVICTGLVAVALSIVYFAQDAMPAATVEFDYMFTWLSATLVSIFIGALVLMSEQQRLFTQTRLATTLEDMQRLNSELSDANAAQMFAHEVTQRDADTKERFLVRMRRESERQHTALDQTGESMRVVETTAATLTHNAEALATSAMQSSGVVEEMTRTNDSVLESVEDLVATANAAMGEIESMTSATNEIADAVKGLSIAAEETSMSMNQMQASTAHIQENARTTADLAEAVIRDAESGVEKVMRTVRGIEAIRNTSNEVFETIRRLDHQSHAITDVLVVIDDVTHQTNLLALNAAILAAQAGDEGQGFAVVADEIKKLAERTRSSTTTIADLIFAVRNEAENAVKAIRSGETAVAEGVRLSQDAETAFSTIVESAQRSTEMARAIATASAEQLHGAGMVSATAQQVATTVSDVAAMSQRQAEGGDNIVRAANRMRSVSSHVERSTAESAKAGREILTVMTELSSMSAKLNAAQLKQREGTREVLAAIEEIREAQDRQAKSLRSLAGEGSDDDVTDSGFKPHPAFQD